MTQFDSAIILPKWHKKQLEVFHSRAQQLLLAGDTRAGKSFIVRKALIIYCSQIPGLLCDIFRVNCDDVHRNYMEGETSFPVLLAQWERDKLCKVNEMEIVFWNDSRISLEHCSDDKVMQKHQGISRHVRVLDECTQIPEKRVSALAGWVTMSEDMLHRVPDKWKGAFPKLWHVTNPLGQSSIYYRKHFVESHPPGSIWQDGPFTTQYIPMFVEDNPSENEETTRARIKKAFGSEAQQDALLAKDRSGITNWQTRIGAYLPQIDLPTHLVEPFAMPNHWPRFMAYDHGSCGDADPFSIGWYAVAGETFQAKSFYTKQPVLIQRDSLVCYRRWNGRGLPKVDYLHIANGIKSREMGENILFRTAGGDIVEQRGHGESIFSLFSQEGINFIRADNRILNGVAQVEFRLNGTNEWPLSFWFAECEGDLETMSSIQHDPNKPNYPAKGDDHDFDRHRYACMTRPLTRDAPKSPDPIPSSNVSKITPELIVKRIRQPKNALIPKR